MMNRTKILTFVATLLVTVAGFASAEAKAPAWYADLATGYPTEKYLAAVGTGDTRADAESNASAALARMFTVTVKVDATSQKRYSDLTKGDVTTSTSDETYTKTVNSQSNEQFVNLRFSDAYTDTKGTTSVVAFLERIPTSVLYRALIQKDLARVDEFRKRAADAKTALLKFALADAAYQVSLNAERLVGQLRIIRHVDSLEFDPLLPTKAAAQDRDTAAQALTYKLSIEGDTDGKVAGIVKKVLSTQSLSFRDDGLLSVKGSWKTEAVTVNPKYKSVHWTLNLSLLNEQGAAVATVFKDTRENALTDAEALALAYKQAEKRMDIDFSTGIGDYLTRVATKN